MDVERDAEPRAQRRAVRLVAVGLGAQAVVDVQRAHGVRPDERRGDVEQADRVAAAREQHDDRAPRLEQARRGDALEQVHGGEPSPPRRSRLALGDPHERLDRADRHARSLALGPRRPQHERPVVGRAGEAGRRLEACSSGDTASGAPNAPPTGRSAARTWPSPSDAGAIRTQLTIVALPLPAAATALTGWAAGESGCAAPKRPSAPVTDTRTRVLAPSGVAGAPGSPPAHARTAPRPSPWTSAGVARGDAVGLLEALPRAEARGADGPHPGVDEQRAGVAALGQLAVDVGEHRAAAARDERGELVVGA